MNFRTYRGAGAALAVAFIMFASPTPYAADRVTESGIQPDIYNMVTAIAEPTAGAKIGGNNQRFEKVVTISRDGTGTPVVTSMQVIAPETIPQLPERTLAIMVVHYEGQCPVPYGNDGARFAKGVLVFVVSPSAKYIWQVEDLGDVRSMRLVKSAAEFGAWEAVQPSPDNYRTYRCGEYH